VLAAACSVAPLLTLFIYKQKTAMNEETNKMLWAVAMPLLRIGAVVLLVKLVKHVFVSTRDFFEKRNG